MSGIIFDIPSVRLLRRFRLLERVLQTIAAPLVRWLSAPVYASRRVYFRHDEAEFPSASQSACKQFEWTLDDSRAADGVLNVFGALRHFDNWTQLKDQHELLFIRKTLTPPARWGPTQREQRTVYGPAGSSKNAEKNILAAGCGLFRKRRGKDENRRATAQWLAALATRAQT
jgi:hypothetical protein